MRSVARRAVVAFSVRSRRRKARFILDLLSIWGSRTVAIVGVGGMRAEAPNEGIVERGISSHSRIVAALDMHQRDLPWPMVVGDGCHLPWRDRAVDVVLSNAVIEHVGGEAQQSAFVAEHLRVGRAWILTTPNRWFPVESHTSTVLLHWWPAWRAGREEFTRLLSKRELRRLLPEGAVIVGRPWSPTFSAYGVVTDTA